MTFFQDRDVVECVTRKELQASEDVAPVSDVSHGGLAGGDVPLNVRTHPNTHPDPESNSDHPQSPLNQLKSNSDHQSGISISYDDQSKSDDSESKSNDQLECDNPDLSCDDNRLQSRFGDTELKFDDSDSEEFESVASDDESNSDEYESVGSDDESKPDNQTLESSDDGTNLDYNNSDICEESTHADSKCLQSQPPEVTNDEVVECGSGSDVSMSVKGGELDVDLGGDSQVHSDDVHVDLHCSDWTVKPSHSPGDLSEREEPSHSPGDLSELSKVCIVGVKMIWLSDLLSWKVEHVIAVGFIKAWIRLVIISLIYILSYIRLNINIHTANHDYCRFLAL